MLTLPSVPSHLEAKSTKIIPDNQRDDLSLSAVGCQASASRRPHFLHASRFFSARRRIRNGAMRGRDGLSAREPLTPFPFSLKDLVRQSIRAIAVSPKQHQQQQMQPRHTAASVLLRLPTSSGGLGAIGHAPLSTSIFCDENMFPRCDNDPVRGHHPKFPTNPLSKEPAQ